MKLLLLVAFLVAGALGGVVLPRAAVVGYPAFNSGVNQARASDDVMDWAKDARAAQQWAAQANKVGADSSDYGDSAGRAAAKAQNSGSDYGSRAANWDQNASAGNRAADRAALSGYAANQWADAADANKALKDQQWAQGNQFYQGRRKNDDTKYAYDKSFDLRDSNNGGFHLKESSNSHALDDFRDRAANFDRSVDQDAAAASAADAARANKKSAWGQNAASGASNWDKFSRDSANAASGNGRAKDWANKIDQSQGAKRVWSDARRAANEIYKDLATADGSYQRNAKELAGKNGVYGAGYGYGLAGLGGYAAKPGYYVPVAKGAAADAAKAWDQASKSALRQADAAATADNTNAAFSRDQWLNDRSTGFDRNAKNAASDKGASDWARQAAQSANKADAASADSANAWNKNAAKAAFDENLWKKEADRKRLSDRAQNKEVQHAYFNNKRRGGDNWERLNLDQDHSDDAFGYNTAAKKDWAQAANANQWRASADRNGNNAYAARAADAARNANKADWKKSATGWQNAQAAAESRDAANRKGFQNQKWKNQQASDARDARAQSAQQWDRDVNRDNAAAVGSLAPKAGLAYGAGYLGPYPANGYYGYPAVANKGLGYAGVGYGYPGVGYPLYH